MPFTGPLLNSSAIVDGTAEARFMPLNGALLNSAAIVDGTAEALVNRNKIYSGISYPPTGRVTSITC